MEKFKQKITEWNHVLTIIGVMVALISWIKIDIGKVESRIDMRIDRLESRMDAFQSSFQAEVKDFHGRLIALETKYHESEKRK